MQFKINKILTFMAVTTFAMISAPTLITINTIFAATFNPFDNPIYDGLNFKNKDLFNIKTPDFTNSQPQKDTTTSTNNGKSGSNPGSRSPVKECIPGKCLGTKGYYTDIGHHHCFAGTAGCHKTH